MASSLVQYEMCLQSITLESSVGQGEVSGLPGGHFNGQRRMDFGCVIQRDMGMFC